VALLATPRRNQSTESLRRYDCGSAQVGEVSSHEDVRVLCVLVNALRSVEPIRELPPLSLVSIIDIVAAPSCERSVDDRLLRLESPVREVHVSVQHFRYAHRVQETERTRAA
jgi:hypothetical protein